MSTTVKQKDGRKYHVESGGITSLKRDYMVIQDATMGADGEVASWPGVPAVGSAHPGYSGLIVESYDVQEGAGSDKNVLIVTANYEPKAAETIGTGQDAVSCQVEEWGWDEGTDERELVEGVDGTPVLNSAMDPFETVPKVSVPAPVFTKVMKFQSRQSGWMAANCKVNSAAVTIGGNTFPIGSLLCTVSEKRNIGDSVWKYRYTVRLRYRSNLVKIEGATTATDIGWDVAVTDAGMRELIRSIDWEAGDVLENKKLIRVIDKETGKMCTVTSAALLNGQGQKLADDDDPYNLRFQAYERAAFPSWFYSEP